MPTNAPLPPDVVEGVARAVAQALVRAIRGEDAAAARRGAERDETMPRAAADTTGRA